MDLVTPATVALTQGGWLALLAAVVGFAVRLLKSDTLNGFIAQFGLKPVPKKALPWLALGLGLVSATVEAKLGGAAWKAALMAGAMGLVSGAGAVAGNETLSTLVRTFSPELADLLFGKKDSKPTDPPTPQPPSAVVSAPPPPSSQRPTSARWALPLAAALFLGTGGCAAFWSSLPTVITVVSDATLILQQIQNFVSAYFAAHPDAAKEAKVQAAMGKALAALTAAQRIATGAGEINQAQLDAAFNDFRVAYTELLALVGPLGVHEIGAPTAMGGGISVPAPMAMSLVKK